MSDFRQTFLTDSINKLTALETQVEKDFTENQRREAFRTIHTIKGGAQIFDLPRAAQIAGELENLLSAGGRAGDKNLLIEVFEVLIDSLRATEGDAPAGFLKKLRRAGQENSGSRILLINIPFEVFKNLSAAERNATVAALGDGKDIFCIEAGFAAADFVESYRNLQQILGETSNILASLPSEKHKSAGKIGFRIILASRESAEILQILIKNFDAEISAYDRKEEDSPEFYEMFRQIVAHGARIAEKSGKEIRFTVFSNGATLSADRINEFFEILLHLVRNAVDHAIEKTGSVEILFFDETDRLRLSVADDGKGVDLQKVRACAVAKNLISVDDVLNAHEILELVFAAEVSTADKLTEISGRGIGLDAVKNAVEKMNGKIFVRNRKTNGTVFEIIVPTKKI